MQRAKSFLFVCLGILALAVAYHFGATTATAQQGSLVTGFASQELLSNPAGTVGGKFAVITPNGDVFVREMTNAGSYPMVYVGNFWDGPTPVQRESWGGVKSRYLTPDAARSGQASRPRR